MDGTSTVHINMVDEAPPVGNELDKTLRENGEFANGFESFEAFCKVCSKTSLHGYFIHCFTNHERVLGVGPNDIFRFC